MNTNNHFQASVTIKGVTVTYDKGEKLSVSKSLTKSNVTHTATIVQPTPAPPKEPIHWGSVFGGFYLLGALVALILYAVFRKWRKTDRKGADFMAILIPILVIAWVYDLCKKKKR